MYSQLPSCAQLGPFDFAQGRLARRPSLHWKNGRRGKPRLYDNLVGSGGRDRLGGVSAPVGDFFQTFSAGMLEESDFVASVFEFVDVSPDFGLPRCLVGRGLA